MSILLVEKGLEDREEGDGMGQEQSKVESSRGE